MSILASRQSFVGASWFTVAFSCLWLLSVPHAIEAYKTKSYAATWRTDWTGMAFNYQLAEVFNSSHYMHGVKIYGMDGFDNDAVMVRKLVKAGSLPVCYISGGTFEVWRPDADDFLPTDKGNPLGDWPGENYIDILSPNVRQIMLKRIQMCKSKGFTAVDVDNVDLFEADAALTGFSLTEEDGKGYVLWLAEKVHSLGMAFGLKNAINLLQHKEVVKAVDFAVNEQALAMEEAALYLPLWKAGKAILNIEYDEAWTLDEWLANACSQQRQTGLRSIFKTRDLNAKPWAQCPNRFKPARFPPKRAGTAKAASSIYVAGVKAPALLKRKAQTQRSRAAAAAKSPTSAMVQAASTDIATPSG